MASASPQVEPGLMTSEEDHPRDVDSTEDLMTPTETSAPVSSDGVSAVTAMAERKTVSVGTQTAGNSDSDAVIEDQLARLADQARLLETQTGLLAQLHGQLARSAGENERLQRHLRLVNALFEQLHRKENAGVLQNRREDGADEEDGAQQEQEEEEEGGGTGTSDLVQPVDTAHGRRLVIHVSRTYLRLRDLILEKRSLLSEIDKLRGFNQQLERRLSRQERRLSSVAAELHSTWGLVTRLKIQHAQLHTAESVLRYELREKRKLMSRLRGELEGSRQRSALASQLNAESELEWRALRRELDQRKRERLVRESAETGSVTQAAAEDGDTELRRGAALDRSGTEDSQPDGEPAESPTTSVAESDSIESESAGQRTPESQPADSATAGGSAEIRAERHRRLVSLEDQCQQLYTRLVSTTARQVALSSRLAELHAQHGASETETTPDTSVASSEDTAYASLTDTPAESEPMPVAATAAVLAEVTDSHLPMAVAALRVAAQTDGGPRSIPPLPAVQLATETAHTSPGQDRVLISAVVTLNESPPSGAAPTAHVPEQQSARPPSSDTEQHDQSPEEGTDADADDAEQEDGAESDATAGCEDEQDDVSRSTADLLEKVGQFLSRTRRGSACAPPPPPPPAEGASSDSDTEEPEAERLVGTSAGCKLISLLPSRMVHLRREREQLVEHIARLQAQNERIEQKLVRMREERHEQRRRGREDSTVKERLERRVQQLERQLRLQLAERYAVSTPPPADSEQQPSTPPPSDAEQPPTDSEPQSLGGRRSPSPARQSPLPLPTDHTQSSTPPTNNAEPQSLSGRRSPTPVETADLGEALDTESPDRLSISAPLSECPVAAAESSTSAKLEPAICSTETGIESKATPDFEQSAGHEKQQNQVTPSAPTDHPKVTNTSQTHSNEENIVSSEDIREPSPATASDNCDSRETHAAPSATHGTHADPSTDDTAAAATANGGPPCPPERSALELTHAPERPPSACMNGASGGGAAPPVTYSEFRRRLSERLQNRPATHRSIRQKPASIFKRNAVKCYMCQVGLRALLARRLTCGGCGQTFCRRCAGVTVRLPASTRETRLCLHCFYKLCASSAPSPPPMCATPHDAAQCPERTQAAIADDRSAGRQP